MISMRQFGKAIRALKANGGFSMNARTGSMPSKGWMVARRSNTDLETIGPNQASGEWLKGYADRHRSAVRQEGHIGGWLSGGAGEIEPSHRYPATNRGFEGASRDMYAHNQEAIYNVGKDRTFWNPEHPNVNQGLSPFQFAVTEKGAENRLTHMDWARNQLRKVDPKLARKAFGPR